MNTRTFLWGMLLGLSCLLLACEPNGEADGLTITGRFAVCNTLDTVRLYRLDGFEPEVVRAAPVAQQSGEATFTMSGPQVPPGFYLLGKAPNNLLALRLGEDPRVEVSGNCADLRRYGKVAGAPAHARYEAMRTRFGAWQQAQQRHMQALQGGDASARAQVDALYDQKEAAMDSLAQADPLLAKIFDPLMWRPFDAAAPGPYTDALDHFAGEYLKGADLSDPVYDYLPALSDNMPAFIQIAFQPGQAPARSEAVLDSFLARLPTGGRAHKNCLAAAVSTLDQLQQVSFIKYAEAYRDTYGPLSTQVAAYLDGRLTYYEAQAGAAARLAIGAEAPEIALPTPQGEVLKLSDLRGKVVLIDFWASWCGPCRRENPNVVRVYDRYKNRGFEILGVSLDRSREPWLQAIAADGLTWKHVSDLRFWQSTAAQTYQIGSIPATILLDREGRILAKNLRGPALEAKLAEILGG